MHQYFQYRVHKQVADGYWANSTAKNLIECEGNMYAKWAVGVLQLCPAAITVDRG